MRKPTVWSSPAVEAVKPLQNPSRWTDVCQLELPAEASEGESFEAWSIELRSQSGQTIFQQVTRDQRLLSGQSRIFDLDTHRFVGADPHTLILRRRHQDRSWAPELTRPVPESFRRRYGSLIAWVLAHEIPARTISFCPIGGLANQLFEAGAMLGYARRHDVPWVCEVWKPTSPSMIAPRPTYWSSIFAEFVREAEGRRRDPLKERSYGDPSFSYTEIPAVHDHQILWGHFLSYKYFDPERDELLRLLYGHRPLQDEVDEALGRLRAVSPRPSAPLVSIHVRRGDSLRNNTLTRMNMAYYEEAMARFRIEIPEAVFVVFSDDLPWCRERFRIDDVIFAEGNADTVDLFLMARCDHHIIANSTYSWWSAYLNRNPARRVIYPIPWFAGQKRLRDMSDFFLPDWREHRVRED